MQHACFHMKDPLTISQGRMECVYRFIYEIRIQEHFIMYKYVDVRMNYQA